MKEIPKLYESKNECCGCSACFSICPRQAIIMIADEQGFYYPQIIAEKCIKCYKCVLVCDFKIQNKYIERRVEDMNI